VGGAFFPPEGLPQPYFWFFDPGRLGFFYQRSLPALAELMGFFNGNP
jgi:hypothetical protein